MKLILPAEMLEAYFGLVFLPLIFLLLQLVQMALAALSSNQVGWRKHFAFVPMLVGGPEYTSEGVSRLSDYCWFSAYERRESLTSFSEIRRGGFVTRFGQSLN